MDGQTFPSTRYRLRFLSETDAVVLSGLAVGVVVVVVVRGGGRGRVKVEVVGGETCAGGR